MTLSPIAPTIFQNLLTNSPHVLDKNALTMYTQKTRNHRKIILQPTTTRVLMASQKSEGRQKKSKTLQLHTATFPHLTHLYVVIPPLANPSLPHSEGVLFVAEEGGSPTNSSLLSVAVLGNMIEIDIR